MHAAVDVAGVRARHGFLNQRLHSRNAACTARLPPACRRRARPGSRRIVGRRHRKRLRRQRRAPGSNRLRLQGSPAAGTGTVSQPSGNSPSAGSLKTVRSFDPGRIVYSTLRPPSGVSHGPPPCSHGKPKPPVAQRLARHPPHPDKPPVGPGLNPADLRGQLDRIGKPEQDRRFGPIRGLSTTRWVAPTLPPAAAVMIRAEEAADIPRLDWTSRTRNAGSTTAAPSAGTIDNSNAMNLRDGPHRLEFEGFGGLKDMMDLLGRPAPTHCMACPQAPPMQSECQPGRPPNRSRTTQSRHCRPGD